MSQQPVPYRILVTGSRDWQDANKVRAVLAAALFQNVPAVIVHGACPSGPDAVASWWIRQHRAIGLTEERHPADWASHGKAAGPRRNAQMVAAGADVVLAFIRRGSRGASHTVALARRAGIPVQLWTEP
ncbi:SLOG family protein [Streptomyces sp. NPDC060020]|uniref:SLOG family protein n=1 Tax=Streptomyces sp. NPDC060020 TaxID=3347038 RepID=UPI003695AA91